MKSFDEAFDKRINGLFIFFDVVAGCQKRGVMNHGAIWHFDYPESFFDSIKIEWHVDKSGGRFS